MGRIGTILAPNSGGEGVCSVSNLRRRRCRLTAHITALLRLRFAPPFFFLFSLRVSFTREPELFGRKLGVTQSTTSADEENVDSATDGICKIEVQDRAVKNAVCPPPTTRFQRDRSAKKDITLRQHLFPAKAKRFVRPTMHHIPPSPHHTVLPDTLYRTPSLLLPTIAA